MTGNSNLGEGGQGVIKCRWAKRRRGEYEPGGGALGLHL